MPAIVKKIFWMVLYVRQEYISPNFTLFHFSQRAHTASKASQYWKHTGSALLAEFLIHFVYCSTVVYTLGFLSLFFMLHVNMMLCLFNEWNMYVFNAQYKKAHIIFYKSISSFLLLFFLLLREFREEQAKYFEFLKLPPIDA